ncbi:hypothetical protein H8A99_32375 [Bradyrhizobium sp. Arg68]|uniref:hypothetical protein n=1 Tax=Bradyrhizobium ivorense TaxID=2511166 RepID=UPI001E4C273C|nr:hypothetical protein [Bradyrhizobium ivorense]MCC8941007.1 hypothetical protein [Bradyrhizobium ivorense]
MFDPATTALLRAVLDEVSEDVSCYETGARRCLLERYLHRRGEERESDAEELASFGIAYLHRLPDDE